MPDAAPVMSGTMPCLPAVYDLPAPAASPALREPMMHASPPGQLGGGANRPGCGTSSREAVALGAVGGPGGQEMVRVPKDELRSPRTQDLGSVLSEAWNTPVDAGRRPRERERRPHGAKPVRSLADRYIPEGRNMTNVGVRFHLGV
jgi:hypothetical protein